MSEEQTLLEDILRTQSIPCHFQSTIFHQCRQEVPSLDLLVVELDSEVATGVCGKDLPECGSLDAVTSHTVEEVAEFDGHCLWGNFLLQYDVL